MARTTLSRRASSSLGLPCSTIWPFSSTMTRSMWSMRFSWFVTKMRVVPRSADPGSLLMQCLKMCLPTCASTAESGSSRKITSGCAYTARARLIRAFCPPETLTPRSPISVRSDAGRMARSETSAQARRVRLYRSSSKSDSKRMFSRTVRFMIKGSCVQSATAPLTTMVPATARMSPSIPDMSELLPSPIRPTIPTSSPRLIEKERSRSENGALSVVPASL
mmetsp:Transcript_26835/g.85375  ORF Transcript_26835/g.85375 Transcript_26835/m.85375 type:complete len:221 (+) Transcript_26835:278-940(+)